MRYKTVAVIAANELDDSERYTLRTSDLSLGSAVDNSGVSANCAFPSILTSEAAMT